MPDDKRIDLSSDLDALSGELLRDVREAAENEKKRQQEIKTRGSREHEQAQSKKLIMLIVAIAAIALISLSAWMAFRPGETIDKIEIEANQKPKVIINQPNTVQPANTNNRSPYSQGQQTSERPPTEYEQPSEDPGM